MELKAAALLALRIALRGLARMLLQSSVTSREAEEVVREIFVEVALRDYGLRGRATNLARVAMLTGIDRREVSRLRDRIRARAEVDPADDVHPLSRVLAGWHLDPDFSEDGNPRLLRLDDEANGLPALLGRYAPTLPPVAVRKELARVGAIVIENDCAQATARYYLNPDLDPRALGRYGAVTGDLLATLNHNVLHDDPAHPRLEGRAVVQGLSVEDAEALRRYLDEEGQAFLEKVDAWLEERARRDGPVRAGVGVYLIHDDGENS
mgnify:CR=1 FL=1